MQHVRATLMHHGLPRRLLASSLTRQAKCHTSPHAQGNVIKRCWQSTALPDARVQRLSQFWIPTGGASAQGSEDDAHALLVRAGFLRQAHSGIFHLLPLGNRVLTKLERLIDKHMAVLGSSKVSLSSISSEDLWVKSGRLTPPAKSAGQTVQGDAGTVPQTPEAEDADPEIFKFRDRKKGRFLLAPTHEEEITSLVASTVKSYRDLPLRLYQISRKYRDEARPRQGLLRGREFIMKDLYTFDATTEEALQTYHDVRRAYSALFRELSLPFLVAKADSGSIGGSLSHEYHLVSAKGEDNVISCDSCGHTVNEELMLAHASPDAVPLAQTSPSISEDLDEPLPTTTWFGVSEDRTTLVKAVFPTRHKTNGTLYEVNTNAVKAALPGHKFDFGIETTAKAISLLQHQSQNTITLVDPRLSPEPGHKMLYCRRKLGGQDDFDSDMVYASQTLEIASNESAVFFCKDILLTRTVSGDVCQECFDGHVTVQKAIEIGHTFHLGTRYSKPLSASVVTQDDQRGHIEMGCHGIGVTRLMAATASILMDAKGLNWPANMAPFTAVIIAHKRQQHDAAVLASRIADDYGWLSPMEKVILGARSNVDLDIALDDRDKSIGWRLKDADLVGYPLIVVLGRSWNEEQKVEVQCRRLGIKREVFASELSRYLMRCLRQLQGDMTPDLPLNPQSPFANSVEHTLPIQPLDGDQETPKESSVASSIAASSTAAEEPDEPDPESLSKLLDGIQSIGDVQPVRFNKPESDLVRFYRAKTVKHTGENWKSSMENERKAATFVDDSDIMDEEPREDLVRTTPILATRKEAQKTWKRKLEMRQKAATLLDDSTNSGEEAQSDAARTTDPLRTQKEAQRMWKRTAEIRQKSAALFDDFDILGGPPVK